MWYVIVYSAYSVLQNKIVLKCKVIVLKVLLVKQGELGLMFLDDAIDFDTLLLKLKEELNSEL